MASRSWACATAIFSWQEASRLSLCTGRPFMQRTGCMPNSLNGHWQCSTHQCPVNHLHHTHVFRLDSHGPSLSSPASSPITCHNENLYQNVTTCMHGPLPAASRNNRQRPPKRKQRQSSVQRQPFIPWHCFRHLLCVPCVCAFWSFGRYTHKLLESR